MGELATATHPGLLVPGSPEDVEALALRFQGFARGSADAALRLRRIGHEGWKGPAAQAFSHQVGEVPRRLDHAVAAFRRAGDALRVHARVLRAAQVTAGAALRGWDEAEARSRVWGHEDPATRSPHDPGAPGRARAQALLDDARADVHRSATRLTAALEDARRGAPRQPGLLSRTWDAVSSFGAGAAEATWGLAVFAWKLSPTYAAVDPRGFLDNLADLGRGLAYGAQHPAEFGKALLDWETWQHDPARALGHLLPDLLLTVATAGAGGAARGAAAAHRLDQLGGRIEEAASAGGVFRRLDDTELADTLARSGLDPATPSGAAAGYQLGPPYGGVDDWADTVVRNGERIAFGYPGISGFGIRLTGDTVPADGRALFEGLQVAPRRTVATQAPTLRPTLRVFTVTGDHAVATSVARANPQFGAGGLEQLFLPDVQSHLGNDLRHVEDLALSPGSLRARIEDPSFRLLDPSLPAHPLTVAGATVRGRVAGGAAAAGVLVGASASRRTPC